MIIVKITGGLGNQLFKLNKVLDLNLINKNVYLDLNHYEFDRYKRIYRLKTKFTQNKNISKLFKNTLFRINKRLSIIGDEFASFPIDIFPVESI